VVYTCQIISAPYDQVPEQKVIDDEDELRGRKRSFKRASRRNRKRAQHIGGEEGYKKRPLFKITVEDDPNNPIIAPTATDAWLKVVEQLPGYMQRNLHRKRNKEGDLCVFGLSGPQFFGFGHPLIMEMIEHLPNAEKCARLSSPQDKNKIKKKDYKKLRKGRSGKYYFKYLKIEPPEETDEEEEEEEEEEQTDPESVILPVNKSGCARAEGWDKRMDSKSEDKILFRLKKSISKIKKEKH